MLRIRARILSIGAQWGLNAVLGRLSQVCFSLPACSTRQVIDHTKVMVVSD